MNEAGLPGIPEHWVRTNLENCVEILDSKRIPINAEDRETRHGNIPYYGATGQVGWIDNFIFDDELVLLGEDGAPFLDPFKPKAYVIKGKSWVNNHAHVLKAISNITLSSFLSSYLNTFDYHGYVTGTTRLKLNQAPMRGIPLPLPPLPEQRRIVAKIEELFTKLDAGVEALKKVKAQLKRYRQAVLKYAFEGKLTQEWREANKDKLEPASVLLERIREERKRIAKEKFKEFLPLATSDLPELPKGWKWGRVEDITESMKNGIYRPSKFYSNDGVACLRMYNIEAGKIVWKDIKRMILTEEEVDDYKLEPLDILVNRVNSRELVGKAAPIPFGIEKCVFESKNIRLRIFKSYTSVKFVAFWFQLFGQKYFNRNAQQTVGMASINQEQLGSMPLPIPSLKEMNQIGLEIERLFSITDQIESVADQTIKQSEKLRQSILNTAFKGKLVPQDPTDEPAERLLERIKAEKAKRESETKSRWKQSNHTEQPK